MKKSLRCLLVLDPFPLLHSPLVRMSVGCGRKQAEQLPDKTRDLSCASSLSRVLEASTVAGYAKWDLLWGAFLDCFEGLQVTITRDVCLQLNPCFCPRQHSSLGLVHIILLGRLATTITIFPQSYHISKVLGVEHRTIAAPRTNK